MIRSAGRHTNIPDDLSCHIDLWVGSFTSIASEVRVVSGQHPPVEHPQCVSTYPFTDHTDPEWGDAYPPSKMDGRLDIGSDVWIGQRATILDRVERIGHGAIVGAGSVVTREVLPYSVVAGNPAKVVRHRFHPAEVAALLAIRWWEWADEAIHAALPEMSHVKDFISIYRPKARP